QLAIARQHRCSTWQQLLDEEDAERARRDVEPWTRQTTPFSRAIDAIRQQDLPALAVLVEEHRELLDPSDEDKRRWHTLIDQALIGERQARTKEARAVTDWLTAKGMNLSGALNRAILGFHSITVEEVRYLIERGADPNWISPDGYSVLEHA